MSVPSSPCPNCGAFWPAGAAAVCPNCGHLRPAWPPPPAGFIAPPPPPVGPLLTGRVRGDLALGIAVSLAVYFLTAALVFGFVPGAPASPVYGLGCFVPPVLYFAVRPSYPTLARGLGRGSLFLLSLLLLGLALAVLLVLGLLAVCYLDRNR